MCHCRPAAADSKQLAQQCLNVSRPNRCTIIHRAPMNPQALFDHATAAAGLTADAIYPKIYPVRSRVSSVVVTPILIPARIP